VSIDSRNDLIDAYFDALDESDPNLAEDALADSFVYESLSGDLKGFEGLSEYISDLRSMTESDHRIHECVHGDDATAVEGVVTGTDADGNPAEVAFCDVFDFSADDKVITRIGVYVNDS
jgi:ketosteroid isomerase-like protein